MNSFNKLNIKLRIPGSGYNDLHYLPQCITIIAYEPLTRNELTTKSNAWIVFFVSNGSTPYRSPSSKILRPYNICLWSHTCAHLTPSKVCHCWHQSQHIYTYEYYAAGKFVNDTFEWAFNAIHISDMLYI